MMLVKLNKLVRVDYSCFVPTIDEVWPAVGLDIVAILVRAV